MRKDAVTFSDSKKCERCKLILPFDRFSALKSVPGKHHYICKTCSTARAKEWYKNNRARGKASRLAWARALRAKAVAALGGYLCVCCRETRVSMLDIDHIHNDGHAHRNSKSGALSVYHDIIASPENFQILCCNCNQSKRRNGGFCEHYTEHWMIWISDDAPDPGPYPHRRTS